MIANTDVYFIQLCQNIIFYYLQRIQNMTEYNLFGETIRRMPEFPNLANTLLFIETNKYLPMHSAVSLDLNIPDKIHDLEDQQLSLDIKLDQAKHQTIVSSSIIKKKKVGCTCKKTKCLKMYCQCFVNGKLCTPQCACYGCHNDHQHSAQIKEARQSTKNKGMLGRHSYSRGCNCKKSNCQKKYCECFNAGIACGAHCKCQGCANGQCKSHDIINPFQQKQSLDDQFNKKRF